MESKSNKTIVLECYRKIIRDLDLSLVDDYVSDDYIQHSPTVKTGKAGLLEMLNFLKMMPRPAGEQPSPIIRVIADHDLVAVHLDVKFMGKRMAVIDIFRLANGKLAEHWDAGQVIDNEDDLITSGRAVINEAIDANESKKAINNFYGEVIEPGKFEMADTYLSPGYIDHSTNGIFAQTGYTCKVHRLIAEGDFVAVQCEYGGDDKTFAHYSIFRIEGGKIAEHWSTEQDVPAVMAHENGMF
jgi:predicted SnoaL-like aldol condensation-catalyzing enzyme